MPDLIDIGKPDPEQARVEGYELIVSGRVQGVGFRWFAEREASRRGLRGYVRNRPDGRVEIRAQGEEKELEEFCEVIRRGPPASRVDDVETRSVAIDESLSSFGVRY